MGSDLQPSAKSRSRKKDTTRDIQEILHEQSNLAEEFFVPIVNCSRCGNNHTKIRFLRLTNPVFVSETLVMDDLGKIARAEVRYNYWALCPSVGEPIMNKCENDSQLNPS